MSARLSSCVFLCILALSGCTQPVDNILRVGLANAPDNLDPRFATDAVSSRINRLIYRKLVDFDDHAKPVPSLATWKQLTPLHYRFFLGQEGRTFHDGSHLSTDDVKATYDFVLDPTNGSPRRAAVAMIDHIEAIDADTIDFHLTRADLLFPGYLVIGIVPASAIRQQVDIGRHPVGSGPVRFVRRYPGDRVELERIRDAQRIQFSRIKDPTVRVLKLVRGEVDLIQNDLSPELVDWLGSQPGIVVERRPGSNFSYIGFNMDDPVTANPQIRKAIALGIDRQSMIDHVLKGGARLAGSIFPPSHWAGHPSLSGRPFDPVRAAELVKGVGHGVERPLRVSYKTSTDPLRVRLATIIQAQLKMIGIAIDIQSYDWGTFYGDIKGGRFQMYSLAWVGIRTPDFFRYVFHSESVPPDGANRGRYKNLRVDRLIESAENRADYAAMARDYRSVQEMIDRDLPYVPLWFEEHVFAHNQRVRGYQVPADGNYDGLEFVRFTAANRERLQH